MATCRICDLNWKAWRDSLIDLRTGRFHNEGEQSATITNIAEFATVAPKTRSLEELKLELDKLNDEQEKAYRDAIYLGLPPEKIKEMEARRARIKALSDEIYGIAQSKG